MPKARASSPSKAPAATRAGRALQDAFVEHGGAQCGICTPGMILAALPLKPGASLDEIKTALAGNLCRCTGYLEHLPLGAKAATSKPTPQAAEDDGACQSHVSTLVAAAAAHR